MWGRSTSCDPFRKGKESTTWVLVEGECEEVSWLTNKSPRRFHAWRYKTERGWEEGGFFSFTNQSLTPQTSCCLLLPSSFKKQWCIVWRTYTRQTSDSGILCRVECKHEQWGPHLLPKCQKPGLYTQREPEDSFLKKFWINEKWFRYFGN